MRVVRPAADDLRIIAFYVGKVLVGLGLLQGIPAILAAFLGETNASTALTTGAGITLTTGFVAQWRLQTRSALSWSNGMVTVALAWLVGPLFAAIPLYLSGHFANIGDAFFDAMSGLTTSGLSLLQDLDHLDWSMQLYRHMLHFAGGQGIIVVVLTLFAASGQAQLSTLYVGEGREERFLPNIIRTARFIYTVATVYLVVGTLTLFLALLQAGFAPGRAILHAVNLFMAAFDTGGFAPHSNSIAYYHSATVEAVLIVLMIAGTLSFGMHFQLWRGRRAELWRNLETRTLAITTFSLAVLLLFGLARSGAYTEPVGLLRRGFFTLISAHTGTGFAVISPELFITDWGRLAPAAIVGAMAIGGMASSTAGGFKAIRIGLIVKGLAHDIRRLLLPDNAYVVTSYHSQRRRLLEPEIVRSAATIVILFAVTYLLGAMVGLFYEQGDITETLFESVSATANVGLTIGITQPDMPVALELTYILQMWLGRLEFMAVFAGLGFIVSVFRGRE